MYGIIPAQSESENIAQQQAFYKRSSTFNRSLKTVKVDSFDYFVKSEDILLKNDENQLIGTIYSFSYLKRDADEKRPVTFVFLFL